jgi:replication fork clamp-binding protein CrfC
MGIALQRSSAKVEGSLRLLTPSIRVSNSRIFLVPQQKADEVRLQRSKYTNQVSNQLFVKLKTTLIGRKKPGKCEAVICFAP